MKSKLFAVYGNHDGTCLADQECFLCHFEIDKQPKKVQNLLYKWMVMDEKPESTTDKQRDAWARKVSRLPTNQREYLEAIAEAVGPEDSPWKTTGQGQGLVSDLDLSDQPLPVQELCWELMDFVKANWPWFTHKPEPSDWEDQLSDWRKKVAQLEIWQQYRVEEFCESLRGVWVKKDEVTGRHVSSFGTSHGDHTNSRPVSVGIH
tara:strand:- start:1434 stop:2048 length:615 start_codon:yes stop_codon:yes gene_type:complete